ncbi:hypothetical protein [Fundidesulfovibrio terrae]|uniref:hypothetical protein n=1 Tax=Fundidesulfovibrio terrae TaxID=2922866 RepID=UPI001FAF89FF|nr:hypothetical protein [Fundidesulfovibrio terrae]
MTRLFTFFFCLLLPVAALAEPARFEARTLALPPALWEAGGTAVSGQLYGRVAMRKVKYARVLAERALDLPAQAAAWSGTGTAGEGGGVRRLEIAAPGASLAGFNEARLDYLTADPARPGCLGLAVALAGPGRTEIFVSDPLETVDQLTPGFADAPARDAVDVARADWTAKGLRYQISRLLDREPDQLWRYSQDGLSTFVQRRFRKDLTRVGAIDVVLARGQDVQVNLVVSLDAAGKGKTVLDWYAIPKRIFDLGDGRTILRLYVGRHLREIAPGAKAVSLKEMALMFFKQNQDDVVRSRNVERILFVPSGLDSAAVASGLPRNLPARAREVFSGRGELAANLEELRQAPFKDMALSSVAVLQSPQDLGQPFAQTLEGARLADVAPRRDVPALLAATAERCSSFGAPCDIEDANGLVGQDPLWSVDFGALSQPGGEPAGQPGEQPPVAPAFAGQMLSSPGRLAFSSAPDGLGVECSGGGLTLETGASFTPEPGRAYSLWLELGRARQGLSGVTAQAYGSGRTVSVAVKPGMPAVFPELPPKVEGVRLDFSATGPELSLTLRRAVLQSWDKAAPRRNLFSARYLFDESRDLMAARTGPASLTLSASGPAFDPQWLVLDLATPPWNAADEPPCVDVAFGGRHAKIPLRSPSSRVAVYLPGAPGLDARANTPGWPAISLALTGGASGAGLECPRAVLAGQRLATWPQVLETQGLLDLAGDERTLSGLDQAQAESMANSARWLPMGKADVPSGTGPVRFARNPWLEVEALLLADASGPALKSLGRPAQAAGQGGAKTGKLLGILVGTAALCLAWLAARRGVSAKAFEALGDWLDASAGPSGAPLRVKPWLIAALAVLAAGILPGAGGVRLVTMLGTLLAVPIWRALRVRIASRFPGLAGAASLHYCSGFLACAALAAAVRAAGAAPVSETFGMCGLWLFCAALATHFKRRPNAHDSAGSTQ